MQSEAALQPVNRGPIRSNDLFFRLARAQVVDHPLHSRALDRIPDVLLARLGPHVADARPLPVIQQDNGAV